MEAITEVKEYSVTEASLAGLRQKYQDMTFDVATTKGDKEARAARLELVKLRTGLDAKRKEIKAPALAYCQLIDSEAKRITAEIVKLEDPIDAMIKAEEVRKATERAEKERIERERITAIHARIAKISGLPAALVGKPSEVMLAALDDLQAQEITLDDFAEFTGTALAGRQTVVEQIQQMVAAMRSHEADQARLKAEREELARQQAAQRQRDAEAQAQREAEEKARLARIAAEDATRRHQEEADRAARAEADRIAAEQRAAEQARIDEQAAQLRRDQEAFAAQLLAAATAAKSAELPTPETEAAAIAEEPAPAFALVEPTMQIVRPTDEQLVMCVADAFTVTEDIAYQWLMEFSGKQQVAA